MDFHDFVGSSSSGRIFRSNALTVMKIEDLFQNRLGYNLVYDLYKRITLVFQVIRYKYKIRYDDKNRGVSKEELTLMLLIDNNVYVLYGLPGIGKITLISNAVLNIAINCVSIFSRL